MIRGASFARAFALVLACAPAWSAQSADDRRGPGLVADARQPPEVLAALRVDPRTLPRAAAGRWKEFDPERVKLDLPAGMREVAVALSRREYAIALLGLQRVLRAEPEYPLALHELGVVYFRLQRYGDAIVPLERYLDVLPERVADTRVLGHAYYSLGRYEEAQAHYERVLAREPDMVEAVRGLALARMRLGDAPRALELLERVLTLDPKHAEAAAWKAQLLYDQEELEPARAAALRARDLDPSQPKPWFLLGRIEGELGRADEARAAQRRYEELQAATQAARGIEAELRLKPHDVALLERLVEATRATGSIARTREALQRWGRERPDALEVHLRALQVLRGLGDLEGARSAAKTLEERFGDRVEVWSVLFGFYAAVGDRAGEARAGERLRRLGR
ncbi:MAG: tetratricopeptide repeat protein [Planctomycetes bacterium]|nr:tetratricopeptide repeat protein [Planctomycetota bacterium]